MTQERGTAVVDRGEPAADGIYVYCIIESTEPCTFGAIGIGGRGDEVYTVHYRDLAAVVSKAPLQVYDPTRENALTHEHVNEVVMIDNGFTPVPGSSFSVWLPREARLPESMLEERAEPSRT